MNKINDKKRNIAEPFYKNTFCRRNKFFCGTAVYLAAAIVIYIFSRTNQGVADFVCRYIGGAVRFVLAGVTSLFPFSVAEAFLILLFPFVIIFLFFVPDEDEGRYMTRNSYAVLGVLFLIVSIYLSAFAPCYFRTSVEDELSLERETVTKADVYNAAVIVSEEIKNLEGSITADCTGKTLMPYSYSELVFKLNEAYESVCKKYDFISDFYSYPKPLIISELMPYTRISGFYTFFTGESNVSTAYPDFMLPYTMAHEMAHQRGIAREDEANFIAFLVCMESADEYIRYSGYTELMNYLTDALYLADYALYSQVYSSASVLYKNEYAAYVSFIRSTDSKKVSGVTESINNSMLQSQGQEAGSDSYGLVAELAAAFYRESRG